MSPMALRLLPRVRTMATSASLTPVEHTIRRKLNEALQPTRLDIYNDSHKHAHHQAMQGVASKETHFRLVITSKEFSGKPQIQRHRLVNRLLDEDLKREGGIHALQLRTLTPEEDAREGEKEGLASG